MNTAGDGDGVVVVGEGLLEVGVHLEDAVVVPELDLALEDLGQDAAGQVEAGGSVGDAGDVVEDGDGTEDEGEVDHLLASVGEGLVVGGRDGDVAGAEVVVGDVGVGSGVVDAEELLLAGGRADGTVREADGLLCAIHELVHQHPDALGGVRGSGTMDVQNLSGGGDGAATEDGGEGGGDQVLHCCSYSDLFVRVQRRQSSDFTGL